MQDSDQWHYLEAGTSVGPFSQGDLVPLVKSGVFSASTRVWNPSLEDWKPAGDTELAALFAPPPSEPQEKAATTEQAPLSQEHYIASAMRGLLAATIASAITIGEAIPTLAHGVVFSAVVFPYFNRLGIVNPQRIFGLVVLIAVAYTTAFMISYDAWDGAYKANRSAPTDVLAGPGFISGIVGYTIPICLFLFLKQKPNVNFISYFGFAIPFGIYSLITMPLAASIERPTGEPMFYPTEFLTSMIVHAPWQAAFAAILAYFLGKSAFRQGFEAPQRSENTPARASKMPITDATSDEERDLLTELSSGRDAQALKLYRSQNNCSVATARQEIREKYGYNV